LDELLLLRDGILEGFGSGVAGSFFSKYFIKPGGTGTGMGIGIGMGTGSGMGTRTVTGGVREWRGAAPGI
jgi:hypothetical protein